MKIIFLIFVAFVCESQCQLDSWHLGGGPTLGRGGGTGTGKRVVAGSFGKGKDVLMRCETARRKHFLYSCPDDEKFIRTRCDIATGNFKPKQCYGQWCYCVNTVTGDMVKDYKFPRSASCAQNCKCALDESQARKPANKRCESNGNYQISDCLLNTHSEQNHFLITQVSRCSKDGSYMATSCKVDTFSNLYDAKCICLRKDEDIVLAETKDHTQFYGLKCDCALNKEKYKKQLKSDGVPEDSASVKADKAFLCQKNGDYVRPCRKAVAVNVTYFAQYTCDKDGYFEALQCQTTSANKCFCADKYTGEKIDNYEYYFNDYRLPSSCECARHSQVLKQIGKSRANCKSDGSYKTCVTAKSEWIANGGKNNETAPRCSCVGTYQGKQCPGDTCHCVDPHGNYIGFAVPKVVADSINMTCDCARDYFQYLLAATPTSRVQDFYCDNAGSYT